MTEASERVTLDPVGRRFVIAGNGGTAELLFHRRGQRLVIEHTSSDKVAVLVTAAVKYAREHELAIEPHDQDAVAWLKANPEAHDGVTVVDANRKEAR